MSKQIISLRSITISAISASLCLSVLSVAQASQRAETAMHQKKHVARIHHPLRRESELSRKIYDVAPNAPGCTWPYKRMIPPCMSTWPEGDANYHGTLRGNQYE